MTHLGIVVARRDGWPLAIGLALAAAERNHHTVIFAMDEACQVARLPTAAQWPPMVTAGVQLIFCGTSVDEYGTRAALPSEAIIGSQLDHARLLQSAQRLLALT